MDELERSGKIDLNRRVEKAAEVWHWSFVFLYFGAIVFHTVAALRHRKAARALDENSVASPDAQW